MAVFALFICKTNFLCANVENDSADAKNIVTERNLKKMSKKNILALLLALTMAFTFASPALAAEGDGEEPAPTPEATEAVEEKTEEMTEETDADAPKMVNIEPIVLVDNDDLAVKVTGYAEADGEHGQSFNVVVTNKTSAELSLAMYDVYVNKFLCDPYWTAVAPANGEVTEPVVWEQDVLDASGINYIASVDAKLWVYDNTASVVSDDVYDDAVLWALDVDEEERGPATEEPEFSGTFEATPLMSGDVNVTAVDFETDEDGLPILTILVENTTAEPLLVRAENVSINGKACNPFWYEIIEGGMSAYSKCYWESEELTRAKIKSVNSIGVNVTVSDMDSNELISANPVEISLGNG